MRKTFDIWRLYFTIMDHPKQWFEVATSQEVETPYRKGTGWAVRLTKKRALVIGWWSGKPHLDGLDEAADAAQIAQSRVIEDITVEEIRSWEW
jgi:hypothetical protein